MKTILIVSLTTLLFIGCGLEKKDIKDITLLEQNESVNFNSIGQYDLSKYLLPTKNQTNIYRKIKQKYNEDDEEYEEAYMINNDEHITYIIDRDHIKESYTTDYTLKSFKIIRDELVDDFHDIREYRRYVNIGDLYYVYEYIDVESVLYQVGFSKCKITEHLEKKTIMNKNYSDILHLSCTQESTEGVRGEFSERKIFNSEYYLAKNIGQIGAVGEVCTEKKYDKTYIRCIKETKELLNIIE